MKNRRQFTRILFDLNATLTLGEERFAVSILDISLNGALVTHPDTSQSLLKQLGILTFDLNEGATVEMHIVVIHTTTNEIGLRCNAMGIDSMMHLRRMVELNLGDDAQLHKELSQLTSVEH